jgi:hypothetical protein
LELEAERRLKMSAVGKEKKRVTLSALRRVAPKRDDFKPVPCGDVDYDLLYEEVTRKYPKIIARLAE